MTLERPGRPLLSGHDPTLLATLEKYARRCEFTAETRIFEEGSPSDSFHIVREGDVRVEVRSPEVDTDNVLSYVGPGSFLGEVGVLAGTPRSASAVASTAVVTAEITADALQRLCDEDPGTGVVVMRALGRETALRLQQSSQRVAQQLSSEQPDPDVDRMVAAATAAQQEFAGWDETRVDALLKAIADAFAYQAQELAAATVRETTIGNVADKALKITFASLAVYASLAADRGIGPLDSSARDGVRELASPIGVIFGLIPLTEPVATIANKVLISLKARNALILSCHRLSQQVGNTAGELVQDVLRKHGAPVELVQWVQDRVSRQKTRRFMQHPGVGLVLATGGPSVVAAAYSSGKPAIGVGAGNAPAWVCADANVDAAARAVVESKAFDNGLVCGAEQHLIVDSSVRDRLVTALVRHGAVVLDEGATRAFTAAAFDDAGDLRMHLVGRAAPLLAEATGTRGDRTTRVIVFEADSKKPEGASARERLAPVVSLFTVPGEAEALALCRQLLAFEGAGHTAVIHTTSPARAERFAAAVPASRVLVNVSAAYGCCGVLTGLTPSMTLGCGTFGGNSTTDNVGFHNLRNVKRIATVDMSNLGRAPGLVDLVAGSTGPEGKRLRALVLASTGALPTGRRAWTLGHLAWGVASRRVAGRWARSRV